MKLKYGMNSQQEVRLVMSGSSLTVLDSPEKLKVSSVSLLGLM